MATRIKKGGKLDKMLVGFSEEVARIESRRNQIESRRNQIKRAKRMHTPANDVGAYNPGEIFSDAFPFTNLVDYLTYFSLKTILPREYLDSGKQIAPKIDPRIYLGLDEVIIP